MRNGPVATNLDLAHQKEATAVGHRLRQFQPRPPGRPCPTGHYGHERSTSKPGEAPIEEVVAAARQGDEKAWTTIVGRYSGLVAAVARHSGLGPGEVADVSQATWLRLVEHLDSLRQPDRLGSWLAVTARHEAIRMRRRAARETPTEAIEELGDRTAEAPSADRSVVIFERNREIRDAFRTIPLRCQQLLELLVSEPRLRYDEIAAALDMPVGSIGPTRARCLACLRRRGIERSAA